MNPRFTHDVSAHLRLFNVGGMCFMYKFSKDYDLMFTYLMMGNDIFCLVDYDFYRDGRDTRIRDVCRCRRKKDGTITFGVRGVEYGSVNDWNIDEKNTELKLFKDECEYLNLEWVLP